MPPFTREPTYTEGLLMKAIGLRGAVEADLAPQFGIGHIANMVTRLTRKGLVKREGKVPRKAAPPSNRLVLTKDGREVLRKLR